MCLWEVKKIKILLSLHLYLDKGSCFGLDDGKRRLPAVPPEFDDPVTIIYYRPIPIPIIFIGFAFLPYSLVADEGRSFAINPLIYSFFFVGRLPTVFVVILPAVLLPILPITFCS